jgi:regulator of RNase E activity RraA
MRNRQQSHEIRSLEGRAVTVRLADGSVLDRVPLVLARQGSVWVVRDGEDVFLPLDRVVQVAEVRPPGQRFVK